MRQRVVRRIVWAIICTNPPIYLNDVTSVTFLLLHFFLPRVLHSNAILISTKSIEIYWIFFPFLSRLIGINFYQFFLSYTFDAAHSSLFSCDWVVVLFFTLTFSECERKQPKKIFIVSMQCVCVVFDVPPDRSLYLYRMFCLISCRFFSNVVAFRCYVSIDLSIFWF